MLICIKVLYGFNAFSCILAWLPFYERFRPRCRDEDVYPEVMVILYCTHICMFFFTMVISKSDYFVDPKLVAEFEERAGKLAKDDIFLTEKELEAGIT